MARRSLQASSPSIQAIKKALKRKKWSQTYIAGAVGCSGQTIWSLLQGNPTDCDLFMEVCKQLGLNWEEIAELESPEPQQNDSHDIDVLVQEVRQMIQPYIQERCGTMRVLDMTQPIALGDIYTSVNILEKITGRRGLERAELIRDSNPEIFERFCLGDVRERRVPGLEAIEKFSKLMILGKPGAGKTTFLKHLAIQCIGGEFQGDGVPVFITLKDFAEADGKPDLLEYINRLVAMSSVGAQGLAPLQPNVAVMQEILRQGWTLILLDGLDEVRDADSSRVLRQIREFSQQFSHNQFVITCRIAAREYTFERFTEVEIADFNDEQIADFSGKWFRSKNDLIKAERFLQRLKEDAPIRELATSPLLLTLLCLVFEDSGSFPTNRARLYEQGIEKLLRKWNPLERERDPIYKKLSSHYREELLIQIAWKTFKRGNYFFNQREIGRQIREYIQSLPGIPPEDLLKLDSKVVLESIEAQHGLLVERARGIYSFSHLTFHEYFTARKILTSCNPYAADDPTLQELVSHLTEKRWQEVFLLTVGMLDSADTLLLLMKDRIDKLLAGDEKLQQFLRWVDEKARLVQVPYKLPAVRAFHLTLTCASTLALDRNYILALSRTLDSKIPNDLGLSLAGSLERELNLTRVLLLTLKWADGCVPDLDLCLHSSLSYACDLTFDSYLKQLLQQLKEQLPAINRDKDRKERFENWWLDKGQTWTEQLRAVMIEHRNIGHDWQFTNEQKERLQHYYDANKRLVDCLNSDYYVSQKVREEIEETLLLPMKGLVIEEYALTLEDES